jgi:hypothetical protein
MSDGLNFPAGSMLTILRAGTRDAHGDGDYGVSHQIGPCDVPQTSSDTPDAPATPGNRAVSTIDVRGPADSDVRKSDRVRFPTGVVGTIVGEPTTPCNPFTKWAPFVYFKVRTVT